MTLTISYVKHADEFLFILLLLIHPSRRSNLNTLLGAPKESAKAGGELHMRTVG